MKREHSPEFKRRIAIEALKERRTINEIASENNIHPGASLPMEKTALRWFKRCF